MNSVPSKVNFDEAFKTPEYLAFREAVAKLSLENKIHIKDNSLVVGKNRYAVPNFVNYQDYIDKLEKERTLLLMKYNDMYENMLIMDNPEKHKRPFEELVTKLNNIEVIIDELNTFINTKNQTRLQDKLKQQMDDNKHKTQALMGNIQNNIAMDNSVVKEVLSLYKKNLDLHNALGDAKHILPHDYVIVKKEQQTSRTALKHSTLTKRQKVKTTVKKLMIDKLQ